MKASLLVVTCYFGDQPTSFFPPPDGCDNVCFSNNQDAVRDAQNQGWTVRDVSDAFPLSSDSCVSSLQAKYVKFLGFVSRFPELARYEGFYYLDHKLPVTESTVKRTLKFMKSGKSVVIRKHPEFRDHVFQEVREALGQERYRRNMSPTLDWVEEQRAAGRRLRVRIPITAIILWRNDPVALEIASEIYKTVLQLEQPECQIIWPIVAQKWRRNIRMIPYNSLGIRPKQHPPAIVVYTDRLFSPARALYRQYLAWSKAVGLR